MVRRSLSKVSQVVKFWGRGSALRRLESMEFQSGLGDSAWLLYGLVRSAKPQVCVEIGSARGKSACFVGMALRENGQARLYAIDPHTRTDWNDNGTIDTLAILKAHLRTARVEQQVQVLQATSEVAAQSWTESIDMIFIDGDHSYDGVRRDFELFRPFMKPDAFVVFHDTAWDISPRPEHARAQMGVPRFVEELRRDGYPLLTVLRDFGVTLVQPIPHGLPLQPA